MVHLQYRLPLKTSLGSNIGHFPQNSSYSFVPPLMVYVNSQKFACESCIKGHRSSSCHHTDRPLFEIKKKGRPVSQCTKCRELRQSKKLHSKCTCNHKTEPAQSSQVASTSTGTKSRRFIPIVPALPNGLRDVLGGSNSSVHRPADARQRVDSLLNPCTCTSVWTCQCRQPSIANTASSSSDNYAQSSCSLDALAQAAAMQRPSTPPPARSLSSGKKVNRSRPSSPTTQQVTKRLKSNAAHTSLSPGPELAPILTASPAPGSTIKSFTMPTFDYMPSMSEIRSLAGSGCTCGVQCACPGCAEHRNSDDSGRERKNCADGCGVCIDHSVEDTFIKMRQPQSGSGSSSTSFLDQFFARAASLPSPPPRRQISTLLDPMDTTVFTNTALTQGVNLPKLECCGGKCSCPAGACTCGGSCAGCCVDERESSKSPTLQRSHSANAPAQTQRSCCA